ncbi:MAG TPA: ribulokinase [Solirubrobacteraceae bacterium]|nr:ribulokinase [Solirubrobacteraceae bacterium]
MSDSRYAIGVDFGTESGRAVLVDLGNGEVRAAKAVRYPSVVIDQKLPSTGERLPHDYALQDPDDWVKVLEQGIPSVIKESGVDAEQVVGLGIDFTSCTVLPTTGDGTPLCTLEEWRERRHAWPKLWKHHAAQPVADRLNEVALERGEDFLARYGGRISSEWYFPKLIEVWLEDRDVYDACAAFIEATDWIVWWLTGSQVRQTATAGFKAMWSPEEGLPPVEYFTAAYPGFDKPGEKLGDTFVPLGSRAGTLRPEIARKLKLSESTAVAVGNVDAWVSVPGVGVEDPGTFVIVIGTSICDMIVHPEETRLPGVTGVVKDGILPGLYGYEAGQAAVGDMLAWFVDDLAQDPDSYGDLEQAAAKLKPGETGLVALDWWNGNRTILADADLTGAIFGLTLQTRREEIYRALLESIAFGSRRIMDNFEEHGLVLSEIVACGGIAERSPLMMQLLADTSGRRVHVPEIAEIPARGAALFGAVAAGVFDDIGSAIEATRPKKVRTYEPDLEAKKTYDRVYEIYRTLYEFLGRSEVRLLHELKRIGTERSGA